MFAQTGRHGKIKKLRELFQELVHRSIIPGAAVIIEEDKDIAFIEVGNLALGTSPPFSVKSICRLTSMTKPIAAAAALSLVNDNIISLDDPIDDLIPELSSKNILIDPAGPLSETIPCNQKLTLRSLLTCRIGLGIYPGLPRSAPIMRAIEDFGIMTMAPPQPPVSLSPDVWIGRVGSLPLMCLPDDLWLYNTSFSVLGVLLSRATGRDLAECLSEHVFQPLGMVDTRFKISNEDIERVTSCYEFNSSQYSLTLIDSGLDSRWLAEPKFPSASGGLVSTALDYHKFARALLKGGNWNLTPALIKEMTSDQLLPHQKRLSPFHDDFWKGCGWGFGVNVYTGSNPRNISRGSYGWEGAFGSFWLNDPKRLMSITVMVQCILPESQNMLQDLVFEYLYC